MTSSPTDVEVSCAVWGFMHELLDPVAFLMKNNVRKVLHLNFYITLDIIYSRQLTESFDTFVDALVVLVEDDNIGNGFFAPVVVRGDELQFDAHMVLGEQTCKIPVDHQNVRRLVMAQSFPHPGSRTNFGTDF